jgi:HPt (histidine-containing phosphotransfer) domain-containing protein
MNDDTSGKSNAERQLREEVATLAAKFLRRTHEQAASLSELATRVGEGDANALEQLEQLTHKIHGSGAIFGFAAISEAAGELERLCDGLSVPHIPPAPEVMQRLARGIEQLAAAVAEAERAKTNRV